LSEVVMNSAFPAVVRITLNSDDSAILQVSAKKFSANFIT
jgi:hypothetical protein